MGADMEEQLPPNEYYDYYSPGGPAPVFACTFEGQAWLLVCKRGLLGARCDFGGR